MNSQQMPSIELIQGAHPQQPPVPRPGRRWKIFLAVLLTALAIGLAFVYGRTPVYRVTASVLTVKPKAVDTRSAEADAEHVAIQGRLLLGEELLGRLSQRLFDVGEEPLAVERLRDKLSVVAIPETNLLELRAEGNDPQRLQRIVNQWAEAYEELRAEEIEAATGRTTLELEERQGQLQARIDEAREDLLAYREANDIVSLEREENRSLASLKGLNASLSKARERLVEAQARQIAVDEAIARGETVIPSEQKSEIALLQRELQKAKAYLSDLEGRYTQTYIERDPVLKALPGQIRNMERELDHALGLAGVTVQDEAVQAVEAAQVSVEALERQLGEQQRKVQLFTDRFKEFQALEEDLARLEALQADSKERLATIQVGNLKRFPPIQIVERARIPTRPIHPDYQRDLMIALASALALAVFVTWLVDYLSERPHPGHAPPYLGVRIVQGEQPRALDAAQPDKRLALDPRQAAPPGQAPPSLPILPRELSSGDLRALLSTTDPVTAGYLALLLSGVSPYELPLMHSACFDHATGRIDVPGAGHRELTLSTNAWRWLEPILSELDRTRMALPVAELDTRLRSAARDGQLVDPGSVNALAVWHSYVVYLVRQGIEVSALIERVGDLPSSALGALLHYAPPGGKRPSAAIDFTYPALAF